MSDSDTFDINDCMLLGGDVMDIKGEGEPKAKKVKVEEDMTPKPIDPALQPEDLICLIKAEYDRKGSAGHHLDSVNSFYKDGIRQIITSVFAIDFRIKNERDASEEDREITDVVGKVTFTDVKMMRPTITDHKTGKPRLLLPNMARKSDLTYASPLYISADINVTAILKSGGQRTRTSSIKDLHIANIPVAVKSIMCNTYMQTHATLKQFEEDPRDPGGYFIIDGGEWCIDSLENTPNNVYMVHKHSSKEEIARGMFISKPGDGFENSYMLSLRYLKNGAIVISVVTNKFEKFEIPFYVLFRIFGMNSDREIFDNIVYGVDNEDAVTHHMIGTLERAMRAPAGEYDEIKNEMNHNKIIEFLALKLNELQDNTAAKKDENIMKYVSNGVLYILDKYVLPHVGGGVEHRIRKLKYVGYLINLLLRVEMEVVDPTDRDSYRNKRIHATGVSLSKAFKMNFNFAIVQEIKNRLIKDFKAQPFSKVALNDSIKAAVKDNDLLKVLSKSISSGTGKMAIKKREVVNRVSSQTLYRKNDLNMKSTLNVINSPSTGASKQNERADEMRRVHPSYVPGFIDVTQSADTGEKVGMTKQMGITTGISPAHSSFVLKQLLADDEDILELSTVVPSQITFENLAKVFVNGDWIGCCREPQFVAGKYRAMRRRGEIHHYTTIACEIMTRELRFWTDPGRLLIPLIVVHNNYRDYVDAWRDGRNVVGTAGRVEKVPFKQWIKLTSADIAGIQNGSLTMDDLRERGIIEYITPDEAEDMICAPNIDALRKHEGDVTNMFTHVAIDQAILGIVTLASPMANHSSTTRITMYTNHRKQSAAWFALNFPYRIDKNTFLQYYCEMSLIKTLSDGLTYPNGQNVITAFIIHGGDNQEDSGIANQSSIDCGMFNGSRYYYESTQLDKGEMFRAPDTARTLDPKKDAVYEFIGEDGLIKVGTIVQKNYVLAVKLAKIPNPTDQFEFVDKSLIYKQDEPAYVEEVIVTRNSEDILIVKVKLRSDRPLSIGDKACLPSYEVLTTEGWKPIANVTLNDSVACLIDNKLEYHHPSRCIELDHDEDIYSVENNNVKLEVTPDHRMYVARTNSTPFGFELAGTLLGKKRYYKKNAEWLTGAEIANHHIDAFIPTQRLPGDSTIYHNVDCSMDNWLKFLGIFFTKCSFVKHHLSQLLITCSPNKAENLEYVEEVVANIGQTYYTPNSMPNHHYMSNRTIVEHLKSTCLDSDGNFKLPDYVWSLNKRQCNVLLEGLLFSGGRAKAGGGQRFHTQSKRLADDISRLALHCGVSGSVTVAKHKGQTNKAPPNDSGITVTQYNHDLWKVNINNKRNICPVNSAGKKDDKLVKYTGKVYCLTVPGGVFYVRHSEARIPVWVGNCSSRTGNKSIVGRTVPRIEMPYMEDGLIPDLMVNAHGIPTRMSINQLIEILISIYAAKKGVVIDATTFKRVNLEYYVEELKKMGIGYAGHRVLYNPKTGQPINTMIFVGPCSYLRLQKFVIDENYAIRNGPTSALTHQPLSGKTKDGGLRAGEMEKDTICGHGTMRGLRGKFYDDSDGMDIYVCRVCGERAIVNEKQNIYKCKICGDNTDIVKVPSSWVANLFFNELAAMNIGVKFGINEYTFEEAE